ncbi:ArsR/SmtB family transcription factor [Aestuariivirga sp.]|uniref:ArsR/SmtB family transcription factor n=1 Tax=Aestuariivirga sp. TaxID=2650926 RepID=UPI00391C5764
MSLLAFSTATGKTRKDLLSKARRASEMLKALSHEGRLLMLCLLAEGEKSVSEIEEIMEMPQAAVSQQLARLRLDGIVTARRDGRSIFYSIANDDVTTLIETLHTLLCAQQRPMLRRRH